MIESFPEPDFWKEPRLLSCCIAVGVQSICISKTGAQTFCYWARLILITVLTRLEEIWLPYKEEAPRSKGSSFFQIRPAKRCKFCGLTLINYFSCNSSPWQKDNMEDHTTQLKKYLIWNPVSFLFPFNSQCMLLVSDGL